MADYVSEFTTLMASTPIEFQSGPEEFVNDAISQNPLVGMFLRGRDLKDVCKCGPKLKDRIFLEYNSRFGKYAPGEAWDVANPQSHTYYERPWAMYGSYMSWTEQEIIFNNPETRTREGRKSLYKDVKAQKEQDVQTDIIEGMDDALLAVPDASLMESATIAGSDRRSIYSLFSVVNEATNSQWGSWTGASAANAFTTKYGLNPTDYTDAQGNYSWAPKKLQYSYSSLSDKAQGLGAKMEEMTWELDYRAPTGISTGFGSSKLLGEETNWGRYAILTGLTGLKAYRELLDNMGDKMRTQGPQNAAFRSNSGYDFFGIPIDWSPKIDSLAMFEPSPISSSDTTPVTSANAGNAGPRFWFIDTDNLKLYMHKDKMLEKRPPREPSGTVEFWWQPVLLWWQLFPRSIRRQGILYPGITVS